MFKERDDFFFNFAVIVIGRKVGYERFELRQIKKKLLEDLNCGELVVFGYFLGLDKKSQLKIIHQFFTFFITEGYKNCFHKIIKKLAF